MECLLCGSLVAVTNGGPAFVIDKLENRFLACQSLPIAHLDVEALYMAVDRMADLVHQIRKELASISSHYSNEASLPSQIPDHFSRA